MKQYSEVMLRCQCENEDMAKQLLFYVRDKSEEIQEERRRFLNKRLKNEENLYIYPEQVNV